MWECEDEAFQEVLNCSFLSEAGEEQSSAELRRVKAALSLKLKFHK